MRTQPKTPTYTHSPCFSLARIPPLANCVLFRADSLRERIARAVDKGSRDRGNGDHSGHSRCRPPRHGVPTDSRWRLRSKRRAIQRGIAAASTYQSQQLLEQRGPTAACSQGFSMKGSVVCKELCIDFIMKGNADCKEQFAYLLSEKQCCVQRTVYWYDS